MPFHLAIQTPTQSVFAGDVESIVAPGIDGSFGVLRDHAPFITALAAGEIELRLPDGATRRYFVTGGFVEISKNRVIILGDSLEPVDAVDVEEAAALLAGARAEVHVDAALAEQRVAAARARLRAARRQRGETF